MGGKVCCGKGQEGPNHSMAQHETGMSPAASGNKVCAL
jgi:hypothetical protein